jgi:TonB family protein
MRPSAMSCPLLLLLAGCLAPVGARAQTPPASMMLSAPATTPEALTQRLVGKTVFLRGFYQGDHLEFDTTGKLAAHAVPGSFALSCLEITKVHFTKHSMEIEGNRIGLHFFGGLPYEDDSKPYERITVSKKPVQIEIERLVIEPEKKKKKKGHDLAKVTQGEGIATAGETIPGSTVASPAGDSAGQGSTANQPAGEPAQLVDVTAAATDAAAVTPLGATPSGVKGSPAAVANSDSPQPAANHDPRLSYVQLSVALEKIFAPSLDDSVISTLPDYWQNYFATKAGKVRAAALDASVQRPGVNVKAPHLLTEIAPDSNEYAQKNNIAGMVLLQTVVGANGRPSQVTIVRPIGFGLDEEAVEAVRNSQFMAGTQDGKPVPVLVNLQVTFRIYSNRTRPRGLPPAEVAPKNPAPGPEHRNADTPVTTATVGG